VTNTHHEVMVTFMVEHPELAQLKMNSVAGRDKSRQLWEELAQKLNSIGTCVKTVQQWNDVSKI
jgi:hypothetical protein